MCRACLVGKCETLGEGGTVLSGVPGSDYTVLHFLCPCKF